MAREIPEYHQHVADQNRGAIIAAATDLFLEGGYDRTSLARVAQHAGVSKATLFKQFPTKAALFEATVLALGDTSDPVASTPPAPGDLHAGLLALSWEYADLLTRPRTAALIRLVISEAPRFGDLHDRTFDFGTLPTIAALTHYLRAERAAGRVTADAPELAPAQLLGMIASAIFWPQLVHPTWSTEPEETRRAVEEAVRTIAARYQV